MKEEGISALVVTIIGATAFLLECNQVEMLAADMVTAE